MLSAVKVVLSPQDRVEGLQRTLRTDCDHPPMEGAVTEPIISGWHSYRAHHLWVPTPKKYFLHEVSLGYKRGQPPLLKKKKKEGEYVMSAHIESKSHCSARGRAG